MTPSAATTSTVAELAAAHGRTQAYAYLDEASKREIRRALLKALAIPGWQVPFASHQLHQLTRPSEAIVFARTRPVALSHARQEQC